MERWHRELPLMRRRQLADLREHREDQRLFRLHEFTAGRPTGCACERGPGVFRKRRPFGCPGRPGCSICGKHPRLRRREKRNNRAGAMAA